jgi:hypothetical protein
MKPATKPVDYSHMVWDSETDLWIALECWDLMKLPRTDDGKPTHAGIKVAALPVATKTGKEA